MTTYHLITATLLVEQREQGDQLVARREAEIALERACEAITAASQRRSVVRATVLESLRIIEQDIDDAQGALCK